jgi:hypothetical protein
MNCNLFKNLLELTVADFLRASYSLVKSVLLQEFQAAETYTNFPLSRLRKQLRTVK